MHLVSSDMMIILTNNKNSKGFSPIEAFRIFVFILLGKH